MKTVKNRIEQIKRTGYNLDFSITFNHAIEIYKKMVVPAGLAFLIFGLVLSAIVMGYVLTSLDWQKMAASNPDEFNITNFSTVGLISYVVAMILFAAISVPLTAGLIKMASTVEKGLEANIGQAFEYFAGPYFVPLFGYGLIVGMINIGLTVPLEFVELGYIGTIVGSILAVFMVLCIPLIIFGNLQPIEAIGASFAIVSKQFWVIVGLIIVASIISVCGIIACCVGMFFTLPIVYAMYYSIYVHSVGFDENEETSELS